MNTNQNCISNQLKEIRYRAKLSQSELARLIGTSSVAVAQWERNSTVPSGMQVKKITELFNKTKNDVKIQIPTTVLQNGSFASRGSTRHAMPSSSQRNLFTENQEIKLRVEPATSILSLLKPGIFFGDSEQNIASILANHQCPSKTADDAVKLVAGLPVTFFPTPLVSQRLTFLIF